MTSLGGHVWVHFGVLLGIIWGSFWSLLGYVLGSFGVFVLGYFYLYYYQEGPDPLPALFQEILRKASISTPGVDARPPGKIFQTNFSPGQNGAPQNGEPGFRFLTDFWKIVLAIFGLFWAFPGAQDQART